MPNLKPLIAALSFALALVPTTLGRAQTDCPSQVTIRISSIGYSGFFAVDLRSGYRPGSVVSATTTMSDSGTYTFFGVCPGTYFFAIGPYESEYVSVTSYFDVTFDGETYNNPEMEVFYTSDPNSGNPVGSESKSAL